MFTIRAQLARLLGHSALSSFHLANAAWVALLASRGFSMIEIGVAESVLHVASLLFEVPSGVISDVFGRKYSLVMGRLMGVLSSLLMAFSEGLGGFAAGMFDDLLQVRTDSVLQDQFPSSQRATLVSVSSLCFSLVMIGMSPLAGLLFECL